jgi:hypothetical protein
MSESCHHILAPIGAPTPIIQERADQDQQDQQAGHEHEKSAEHPRQPLISKARVHQSPFGRATRLAVKKTIRKAGMQESKTDLLFLPSCFPYLTVD